MKIYLALFFSFFVFQVQAQALFDDKYDNCSAGKLCLYCGDTVARYSGSLPDYFKWKIEHSYNLSTYEFRNFDVMMEVYVDSTCRTCAVSSRNIGVGWSWVLKDDIMRWLTNMPDWKPAIKDQRPINSTVVIEFDLMRNFFKVKYVSRDAIHLKKK